MNQTAYNTEKYRVLVCGDEITLLDLATWGNIRTLRIPQGDPALCRKLTEILQGWAVNTGPSGAGEKESPSVKDDAPTPPAAEGSASPKKKSRKQKSAD